MEKQRASLVEAKCDCDAPCHGPSRVYAGLEQAATLFRALADGTRLAILRQLREQDEVCACNLAACCTLAQPTVSHHLKVLREAGLVRTRKEGLWVYYSVVEGKLDVLRQWLA